MKREERRLGETQLIRSVYSIDDGATKHTTLAITPISVDLRAPEPGKYDILGVHKIHGAHWARVKLRLRSVGRDPVEQSLASYLLLDANGRRYPAVTVQAYKPAVSCCGTGYEGDIMVPGDVAVGYVGFQVPRGASPIKLRATDDPGDTSPPQWILK